MFQALIRDTKSTCTGKRYKVYPTLENKELCDFFTFELLENGTIDHAHLVDNLMADDERISIRTVFRLEFLAEQYVAAFGNLYKITNATVSKKYPRGVYVPHVEYVLTMIKVSNPLGL